MLKTIAPAEMKRVETVVMEKTPVTGEELMQRAARYVAKSVDERCGREKGSVLCICGTGNNGGDGMAAMRMLAEQNDAFRGICWILPGKLSSDAERELKRLRQTCVSVVRIDEAIPAKLPEGVVCIIDAMFGTGLARPLEGMALKLCRMLNESGIPVVAVDIPSGLNGETGSVMGDAVRAVETVTFHRPKHGLYLGMGPDYAGTITVADIGIPSAMDDAEGMQLMEKQDLIRSLPPRRRVSHKGSYGRVLLLAGSRGMAGAAALAATAALRTGAGLVTVACPETIIDIVQILCPCATCLPLPADTDEAGLMLGAALERVDAVGAGCGLGTGEWAAAMLKRLIDWMEDHDTPVVLDADALNLLARNGWKPAGRGRIYITPHPAEAARLLGESISDVAADAPAAAARLYERFGANVILKGACSFLYDGINGAVNPFGTPAMAKGGSGDVLTGVLAALAAGVQSGAYVMQPLEMMQTTCALHGLAGENAERRHGQRGVLATDLCEYLGMPDGGMFGFLPADCADDEPGELGRQVTVVVERKRGERDEQDRTMVYGLNFGYVQEVLDKQNEWQDACILGEEQPLEWFEGTVCAVACVAGRTVWAVAAAETVPSEADVRSQLSFLGEIGEVHIRKNFKAWTKIQRF